MPCLIPLLKVYDLMSEIFKVLSLLSQHQRLQNTRAKEKGEYFSSLELAFPANTSASTLDAPKMDITNHLI